MAKYIKSHSNFVVKSRHKDLQSSTIWERDITTIGGVDQYAKGQIPIYKSGNFIITVRNDGTYARDISQTKWTLNGASGDTWTQNAIDSIDSGTTVPVENDLLIRPKQDYYDLRDFAYYGSCVELIRGSINGIIQEFPGELFCESVNEEGRQMVYYEQTQGDPEGLSATLFQANGQPLYAVSNPLFIDIHSTLLSEIEDYNPLRYFCNDGFKNYEIIDDNGNVTDIETWEVEYNSGNHNCPGDKVADITLNGDITISAYMGNNGIIFYFVDKNNFDKIANKHIRPKYQFFIEFYNSLSTFQKLLLNIDTVPKYRATFRIIRENQYGYYTQMETFEFPKGAGGYNISTESEQYSPYIQRLLQIGSFYDELFSDNLWRSMTHEAIKNFDWSFTREYTEGDEEEYVAGGNKIQKMLRLYAREFDECKVFIDSIENTTNLTYDERSNIPDYFLTDLVNLDGWDFNMIYPIEYTEPNVYSIVTDGVLTPYKSSQTDKVQYGYFPPICFDGYNCKKEWNGEVPDNKVHYDEKSNELVNLVRPYIDTKEWTYKSINTEFLKRLKLNSKAILRHKGTIEGIEMILGMFGLKSKRWVERLGNTRACSNENDLKYDYEITEYSSFIKEPIEEKWDKLHNEYRIDWVNSTKLIDYHYDREGITYLKYQGLPIAYRDLVGNGIEDCKNILQIEGEDVTDFDGNSVQKRYLYPYFNSSEQLDGNPYYQMNGGWESKTFNGTYFQFDREDNYVSATTHPLYHETIRNVHCVDTLDKLIQLNLNKLHDGVIFYVYKLSDVVAVVDGKIYPIEEDEYSANNKDCIGYIDLVVNNEAIFIGDSSFSDSITLYNYSGEVQTYNLTSYEDGYHIKGYIWDNLEFKFLCQKNSEDTITSFGIFKYQPESGFTHYFYLDSIDYSDKLNVSENGVGWRELKTDEELYKEANISHDYYIGNNPHMGNGQYDNGYKYMHYFENLFEYALDNDLLDERCYGNDYYYSITEEIPQYGFEGLTEGLNVVDNKDTKIHYFGHYKEISATTSGDTLLVNVYSDEVDTYPIPSGEDEEPKEYTYGQLYREMIKGNSDETLDDENFSFYSLNELMDGYSGYTQGFKPCDEKVADQTTHQIVNNKHVKIKFYLPEYISGNTIHQMECLKFYDTIVLPYVEHMLPSTSIFEVSYTTSSPSAYTITWVYKDENGNDVETKTFVLEGNCIECIPVGGYGENEFESWNGMTCDEISKIVPTDDMRFVATYKTKEYTVTWKDLDGNKSAEYSQKYPSGTELWESSYPSLAVVEDKEFIKWDKPHVIVTGDTTIWALWSDIQVYTFTLNIHGATSKPKVTMLGKTVTVTASDSGYKAVYKTTDSSLTAIKSKDITISGGLPNGEKTAQLTVSPTSWNLNNQTAITYTATATWLVGTSSWGDIPTINQNSQATVSVTTSGTHSEPATYTINKPSWVDHNSNQHAFSANNLYQEGEIFFIHSGDKNVKKSIQIIAKARDTETIITYSDGQCEWSKPFDESPNIYKFTEDAGKTFDVKNYLTDKNIYPKITCTKTTTTRYVDTKEPIGTPVVETGHSVPSRYVEIKLKNGQESVTIPTNHNTIGRNVSAITIGEYSSLTLSCVIDVTWSAPEGDIYIFKFNTGTMPETEYKDILPYELQGKEYYSNFIVSTKNNEYIQYSVKQIKGETDTIEYRISEGDLQRFYYTVQKNETTATKEYVFELTQNESNNQIFVIIQAMPNYIMTKCDYLKLTYSWSDDGDLDTLTYLVSPIIPNAHVPVGQYGTTYKTDYVEYAGDTVKSGEERALIRINSVRDYINKETENLSSAEKTQWYESHLEKDGVSSYYAQIDVYANWFQEPTNKSTPPCVEIISNSGGTPSVDTSRHEITFNNGTTTTVASSQPIEVYASSFANANSASTYFQESYTKIAEIHYYVNNDETVLIPNTQMSFKEKGVLVNNITLNGDGTYLESCDLVRYSNNISLYYANNPKSSTYYPQEGTVAKFSVNIQVNNESQSFKLSTGDEYIILNEEEYQTDEEITATIKQVTVPTSSGLLFESPFTGSCTKYPWITFQIGTVNVGGIHNAHSTPKKDVYTVYVVPSTLDYYALFSTSGKFERFGRCRDSVTENAQLPFMIQTSSPNSIKVKLSGSTTGMTFTPTDFTDITDKTEGNQRAFALQLPENNQLAIQNFIITPKVLDGAASVLDYKNVYQDSQDPLYLKSNNERIYDASGIKNDSNSKKISSVDSFNPLGMAITFPSECTPDDPMTLELDLSKPVSVTGVDSILNADGVDYTHPVTTLSLKCTNTWSSSSGDRWAIKLQSDDGQTITITVQQEHK